jgi:hypothetical protein
MKKTLLSLAVLMLGLFSANAQANFNCNDCSSVNHDLYTELSAGKVIVISWVMPCSSCIGPTLTASNIVQSYASSNPGQVLLYVADDVANTSCSSLNSWVNSNGITANATFSDAAVSQSPYGSPGMPKIVVLGGGSTPTIFFNQNGSAAGNSTALQNAINSALATDVNDQAGMVSALSLVPNPSTISSSVSFVSQQNTEGVVSVCDQLGREVLQVYAGAMTAGKNNFEFSTAELANGIYFIRISNPQFSSTIKLMVAH